MSINENEIDFLTARIEKITENILGKVAALHEPLHSYYKKRWKND